jgi:fructokinase
MSFKVIGIGEVLWDLLPAGPQLGGAPANFACHTRQLGAQALVITRVGNDLPGRKIVEQFNHMGITEGVLQIDDLLPTGAAAVVVDEAGVARFSIQENSAWDNLNLTHDALNAVRDADAVCFGTLAQRNIASAATIQKLVEAAPRESLRVFDVNLRPPFYSEEVIERSLNVANVVKLNADELSVLAGMYGLAGDTKRKVTQLVSRFELQLVALTRGAEGSLLYQANNWSELPGGNINVVDTVGAGDAFTAALVMGLLNDLRIEDIHLMATEVAGFVCTQPGATPVLPPHLRAAFVRSFAKT